VRIAPRVLVLGGMPVDEMTRAVAAVLDAAGRAALSHSSAAAYWGLPGFRLDPLQVTRRRDGTFRTDAFATVHTSRVLLDSHLVLSDGIAVTTPARTLFDLAPHVHPQRLERLVDRCWSEGLVTVPLLERTLRELAQRGRPGIALMRDLITARRQELRPPESGLEARFQQLLAEDGQAPMERQVEVGGGAWIGRVDFLDHTARLIVEIDGDRFHGSLSDRRDDEQRTRELEAAGWRVLRFNSFDIWHRAAEVQRRVRLARRTTKRSGW
jgi:very-short-patch-repair endonuclease